MLRASSAVLLCHVGIALLSNYLRSKPDNTLKKKKKNPELVSPVKIKFFIF